MTGFNESLGILVGALTIPPADPLGYAVPVWILQALSYLTLTLHFLAMNFTIGASLLVLWTYIRKQPGYDGVRHFLGSGLPLGVSYIITLGIPPLLFVQVLYGQLFYSSSVVLGAFWIQVIPAVMAAYGAYYYHKLNRRSRPRLQWLVVLASMGLLLWVGYIYVSNLTLSMSPEKWSGIYAQHPGGSILHHGEPSLHPRFLLFLAGSFAVAGLALIWRGVYLLRWGFEEAGRQSQKLGLRAFLLSPVVWIVAGAGVYATRTQDLLAMFDHAATIPLMTIGIVCGLLAVVFAFLSVGRQKALFPLVSSVGVTGVIASMVIFRDQARMAYLEPYFQLSSVPVNAQWGMLTIFLVSLVIGLALLVFLALKVVPKMAEGARERLAGASATR